MRINARLDPEMSQKLIKIEEATGQTASDIIRRALDLYYQQIMAQQSNPYTILERTGFIGCAEGPEDLSANYKQYLDFGSKYDNR